MNLLKSLTLKNFRGFSDHKIEFGHEVVLIGQNNAGKTTTIEALRVLSVCQSRIAAARFSASPSWLKGHCSGAGFRASLETVDFDFANVQHAYDIDEPAVIKAEFRNHHEVHVYIGKTADEVFCQLRRSAAHVVNSREGLNPSLFGHVRVMPPVGSLLPHEKTISKERLSRYLDGYLAYRHFRNQLFEKPSEYRVFKRLLESTWHGLVIQHFENDHGDSRNEYSLLVREGRFTSEISWHGHGLQAWMQTVWFLARMPRQATVVLDEPDVYLHADLQRKLIKVIEELGFSQAIIATHSPEIIGDVPFQNVIVIKKHERVSKPADNANQIQLALKGMGSLHSIQLAKVAQRGLILFVEGDDKTYLSEIAYKLGSRVYDVFSNIAVQELKGKGNWQHAAGAAKSLKEASGGQIQAALVLDRDYMLDKEIAELYKKAISFSLTLKVWKRKEIENYFVSSEALMRLINARSDTHSISSVEADALIQEAATSLQSDLTLSYADVIQKATSPRIEAKTAVKRAEDLLLAKQNAGVELIDLLDGKDLISKVSALSQTRYGVQVSPLSLCKEMTVTEIPDEIKGFVETLSSQTALEPNTFTPTLTFN